MNRVNNIIRNNPIRLTTNTILLIVLAIVTLYILFSTIGVLIRIVAFVAVCWFILMSLQSTNLVNIPVIRQTYNTVERYVPSKSLWTKVYNRRTLIRDARVKQIKQ